MKHLCDKIITAQENYLSLCSVTDILFFPYFSQIFLVSSYALIFEVQGYLEVKGQRNKSSGVNTHLVKVNDGYHQE